MEQVNKIQKHKDLLNQVFKINCELLDIQEEKFKILTDFLEYEEGLTTDKESAERIRIILKTFGIWN